VRTARGRRVAQRHGARVAGADAIGPSRVSRGDGYGVLVFRLGGCQGQGSSCGREARETHPLAPPGKCLRGRAEGDIWTSTVGQPRAEREVRGARIDHPRSARESLGCSQRSKVINRPSGLGGFQHRTDPTRTYVPTT
jgi:hypothetical protein